MKRIYLPYEAEGFDWDENNIYKNWGKHDVSHWECEEVFFNKPLVIKMDKEHSENEIRYYALGRTDSNRRLFVGFTMRDTLIRPISFRDMTKKENSIYDYVKNKKNTEI